ncbi:hypothetical protein [Erythrobacter dokdonensis]|nr:hypothetical protein [Erythrobacter dokdonensis]
MMFEKVDPASMTFRLPLARRPEDGARLRLPVTGLAGDRPEPRGSRRAGDALRAVEWSEITARLNAARDLRLLLRNESQGRIDAVAASFGDAAASYFAMIDNDEPDINLDALDRSKASGGNDGYSAAVRDDAGSDHRSDPAADATGGDARDRK